ncbi:MAG TPA: trypsin-like serine protease [Amycolatopsis sp.]|uniref:Trypsin-like serine protease n=1 Tax=Amycolatopsis nalaikhensis TaxID=715472 RepID=A0ABY8XV97_9PSEU|nr:trypsin-like serine protease [Amycolatopsis sp. 2-2]WIV59518.1 trypsin-like serine protease [Amycolatopsis sp. 2-2]
MRTRALLSTVFFALAAAVVTAAPASAVANGSDVPQGTFKFAAKLTMTDIPRPDGTKYNSACSGSLIAKKWIITAGHCFHDAARNPVSGPVPYPTSVLLGTTTVDQPGVTRNVVTVYQSPSNDIAIAQLDKPVFGIEPLTLNRRTPVVGQKVTLAGWGSLTSVDPTPGTNLQQGQMKVATVDPQYVGVKGFAPTSTTSACTYDSGAPYFVPSGKGGRIVSVESDGPDCPHDQAETTARVDVVADWIAAHIS